MTCLIRWDFFYEGLGWVFTYIKMIPLVAEAIYFLFLVGGMEKKGGPSLSEREKQI